MHAQAVDCDAWWLKQIAAANLGWIDLECGGEFVKLRLKSEADIDRPVPAHSATGRLVGEHAVAVVLNIWYVVEGAEQRAGIKNGDDAVRTVRAAILYDAGFHGGDTAVGLNCGFQIDNGARTPAVGPENFLARIRDLYRSFCFTCCDCRDDLQRNDFALAAEPSADKRLDHANL